MHDAQLADNSFSDLVFGFDMDNLDGALTNGAAANVSSPETHLARHYGLCRGMLHLADSAAIAVAELLEYDEVFGSQVQPEFDADFELAGGSVVVVSAGAGHLSVGAGLNSPRLRRIQGQALDILPLHGPRLELVGHIGHYARGGTAAASSRSGESSEWRGRG